MRRKSGPVESQAYEYTVRDEDSSISHYTLYMKKSIKLFEKSYFLKVAQDNSSEKYSYVKVQKIHAFSLGTFHPEIFKGI